MSRLADDPAVLQRIFDHIDRRSSDRADATWREPVENYRSEERFRAELEQVLRRAAVPLCPSAALVPAGAYVARSVAGIPLVAVRAKDGRARVFRNACRHRGMALVDDGAGTCERALVCPYHAWTYDFDGCLRGVPHEDGFPGLDRATRGLVPVAASEHHGLVFASAQGPDVDAGSIGALDGLLTRAHRVFNHSQREVAANWKVLAEGFLEGYHLRALHPDTFYPIQYDNLNLVDRLGGITRITFPYRRIEQQRERPPEARSSEGVLTHVYHVFPNAMVITFSTNVTVVVLEPIAVDRTRLVTWILTTRDLDAPEVRDTLARDLQFIDAGSAQDRHAAEAIQRGLASGANEFFEFGLYEGGIVHFHRTLQAVLGARA
ncbi:MAG TPA: aromatic ring-hydroxylating dioxygenase subunit alpha [Caldimonas sp.]|nr:aromatic ring-hydroxylating dioxygenase subunit alpha [Caldimonas sp.]